MKELSVIQKTYDCIKWYVPIIERLPKIHKFTLGDRIINQLYDLLEGLTWIIHQSRIKIAERVILQQLRQFCHPNTL
jgi:hypothetical protein